uniref:Membrane protein-like protein n=2 Tax=Cereibacter TaxID=1653176 RepID=A4WWE9_CERS5
MNSGSARMNEPIFLDSWAGLARTVVVGIAAYGLLIAMLRASGKRTLSKMNAFDFVVTVALGSTLATVLLNRSVPLAEGVAALALLICLQYAITWLAVRVPAVQALVKSEPTLLLHDGCFLDQALKRQRVTRDEVLAALRQSGTDDPAGARSVVLETDGSLSVIPR